MVLSAVLPIVDFLISYLIARCERCYDRSFTSDTSKTKATSLEDYISLYSGPKY